MLLWYFKQALLLGEEVRNCQKGKTQNLRKSHMKKVLSRLFFFGVEPF